jgi:hypothetical protein
MNAEDKVDLEGYQEDLILRRADAQSRKSLKMHDALRSCKRPRLWSGSQKELLSAAQAQQILCVFSIPALLHNVFQSSSPPQLYIELINSCANHQGHHSSLIVFTQMVKPNSLFDDLVMRIPA